MTETQPDGEGRIKLEALSKEYNPRNVLWTTIIRYAETYYLHIFWITLYTLFMFGLFIERYCRFSNNFSFARTIKYFNVNIISFRLGSGAHGPS